MPHSNAEISLHASRCRLLLVLERYLEAELSYLHEIDEGIADAEAGRVTDLEIVKAKWKARIGDLCNHHNQDA